MSDTNKLPKWVVKALGSLNLSEEGKLINFYDFATKEYQKAITSREKALAKLSSEYEEEVEKQKEILSEKKNDVVLISTQIDVEKINKRIDRENYFSKFDSELSSALYEVQKQEELIESIEKTYNSSVEKLNSEINIFKAKLSYFED